MTLNPRQRLAFYRQFIFGILSIVICSFSLWSCKGGVGTSETYSALDELGQQVGDAAASIDEIGGNNGSFTFLLPTEREIQRYFGSDKTILDFFIPPSFAAACRGVSFSDCEDNVRIKNFGECTVGVATFKGSVTLTFDDGSVDNTCSLASNGNSVSRSPNFTITGRAGGKFTVSRTGTFGQKIEKKPSGFEFTNDGIRRVFVNAAGSTVGDFTTETTTAIQITGAARSSRVLNGGTLRVTNNLTEEVCDYSPEDVTYEAGCNCPVSGSWAGQCGSKNTELTITGCGTGSITLDGSTKDIRFDRCYEFN